MWGVLQMARRKPEVVEGHTYTNKNGQISLVKPQKYAIVLMQEIRKL